MPTLAHLPATRPTLHGPVVCEFCSEIAQKSVIHTALSCKEFLATALKAEYDSGYQDGSNDYTGVIDDLEAKVYALEIILNNLRVETGRI